ncbi:MAG: TlpA family protein disulfide reductase [Burkholderiaceae bacterium]|nr:TlpA family protein disulfide reductase [Burkholderiaceae bacterium]
MTPVRRRLLAAAVGAGAAMGGAAVAWHRWKRPADDVASALWSMQFERPEGGKLVMADFRGKPLLINFWATWCVPCIRELPALQRFQREHAARGWQVLALAVDQPVPVLEFITRFKLELTVAMAGVDGLEWQRAMGNDKGGLPFTLVLDALGRPRQRKLGETTVEDLARWAAEVTPANAS